MTGEKSEHEDTLFVMSTTCCRIDWSSLLTLPFSRVQCRGLSVALCDTVEIQKICIATVSNIVVML